MLITASDLSSIRIWHRAGCRNVCHSTTCGLGWRPIPLSIAPGPQTWSSPSSALTAGNREQRTKCSCLP
eukprot:5265752-Amphidinium_carterae.1